MKYIVETNADNGDSFYSEEFDTKEKAIEKMAYEWRLLSPQSKSEIRKRDYLAKDGVSPYMVVLVDMTGKTTVIFTCTTYVEVVTLAEMIEAKENEEKED